MFLSTEYSIADKDDVIIDKPPETDNEHIMHHEPTQTIECYTNEQYFKLFQLIMEGAQEAAWLGYTFQPKLRVLTLVN